MIRLRKTDLVIQCVFAVFLLLSFPWLHPDGFLAALFLPGCWQLVSAFFNTRGFYNNGMRYQIRSFWKYTGLITALLFLPVPLAQWLNPETVRVLTVVTVISAVPVSLYYLNCYKKLIGHLALRHELGGLIRSKH